MKKETFQIYDKEISFNEDVKIFYEAWWVYYFGRALITPEVNNVIQSNKAAKDKVEDIFNLIEKAFINPNIKLNKNKGTKIKSIYQEIESNTNSVYKYRNSQAYIIFSYIRSLFNLYKDNLIPSKMTFDLKKMYLKNLRTTYSSKLEDEMTSYLIKYIFISKSEISLFPKTELLNESKDKINSKDISILNKIIESSVLLIDLYYRELFIEHIMTLINYSIIDEASIIDLNLKKSNNILSNIKKSENKKDIIIEALIAFPGNIDIYTYVFKNELQSSDFNSLIKFLYIDKYLEKQSNKIINSYKKNFEFYKSFNFSKNAMDLLAGINNVERKQYYRNTFDRMYDIVISKFRKLANIIDNKVISKTQEYYLLKSELKKNKIIDKMSVRNYYVGDINELFILQNELGYEELTKDLCRLIGETGNLDLDTIHNKYVEELYKLLSHEIGIEVKKENRKNTIIILILGIICFAILAFFVTHPDFFYSTIFLVPTIFVVLTILKCIFF